MIRKTILLFALAVAFTSCKESATDKFDESNSAEIVAAQTGFPKISVDNSTHDFGDLKLHDKAEHTFVIKNEGTADLVILEAKPSCGCTVPEFPKEPYRQLYRQPSFFFPGNTFCLPHSGKEMLPLKKYSAKRN